MSTTESKRLQLHLTLKEVLGDNMADTLMDHLPPTGWADVARKDDVLRLERQLTGIERRLSVGLTTGLAVGLALFAIQVQILLMIAR